MSRPTPDWHYLVLSILFVALGIYLVIRWW